MAEKLLGQTEMDNSEKERLIEEHAQRIIKEYISTHKQDIETDIFYKKRADRLRGLGPKAHSTSCLLPGPQGFQPLLYTSTPVYKDKKGKHKHHKEHEEEPPEDTSTEKPEEDDSGQYKPPRWTVREGSTASWVEEANKKMHRLNVKEAEKLYEDAVLKCQDILKQSSLDGEEEKEQTKTLVLALMGLAEVYCKNCRSTHKSLPWYQLSQLKALSLYRKAFSNCHDILKTELDDEFQKWFEAQMEMANMKVKNQHELLAKNLYEIITKPEKRRFHRASRGTVRDTPVIIENITSIQKYCIKELIGRFLPENEAEVEFLKDLTIDENQVLLGSVSEALEMVDGLFPLSQGEADDVFDENVKVLRRRTLSGGIPSHEYESIFPSQGDRASTPSFSSSDSDGTLTPPEGKLSTSLHTLESYGAVTIKSVFLSLADTIVRLADILYMRKQPVNAKLLYSHAYELYQDVLPENAKNSTIAYLLSNLGKIHTQLNNIPSGLFHLQRGLEMLQSIYPDRPNVSVANTLFELGNAYLKHVMKDESIFDHVCLAMRNELHNELRQDILSSDIPPPPEGQTDNDDSKSEESESDKHAIDLSQPVSYFKQALDVLQMLQDSDGVGAPGSVFGRAHVKLGDCTFISGNYEESMAHFEKAKEIFQHCKGEDVYEDNTHSICMLGALNFFLHNYTQAITMYQCAYLLYFRGTRSVRPATYDSAFMFSLWGMTCLVTRNYDKCISWCNQALDIYKTLYGVSITQLESNKVWVICETLYSLGLSYLKIEQFEKALDNIDLAYTYLNRVTCADAKQLVRVLKALGDCYNAKEEHENALMYYNKALELAGPIEGSSPAREITAQILQNQLLSNSANVHTTMRQYNRTSEYLQKAKSIEKTLKEDIEADMVGLMHQLGQIHTVLGDIDKAIEAYQESLDAYKQMYVTIGPEMAVTLGNMASVMTYKAQSLLNETERMNLLQVANSHFQQAVDLEYNARVYVDYATFLLSQKDYAEAAELLIDVLLQPDDSEVVFGKVEQFTLPVNLQMEIAVQDEVILPMTVYSKYLSIICYRHIGLWNDATDCLISLLNEVYLSNSSCQFAVLGYAMMELGLFLEAADVFLKASTMQPLSELSAGNRLFCIYAEVCVTLSKGFVNLLEYVDRHMTIPKSKFKKVEDVDANEGVQLGKTFPEAAGPKSKQRAFTKNFSKQEKRPYRTKPSASRARAVNSEETYSTPLQDKFSELQEKYARSDVLQRIRELQMMDNARKHQTATFIDEVEHSEEKPAVLIGREPSADESEGVEKESWEGVWERPIGEMSEYEEETWENSTEGNARNISVNKLVPGEKTEEKEENEVETWEETVIVKPSIVIDYKMPNQRTSYNSYEVTEFPSEGPSSSEYQIENNVADQKEEDELIFETWEEETPVESSAFTTASTLENESVDKEEETVEMWEEIVPAPEEKLSSSSPSSVSEEEYTIFEEVFNPDTGHWERVAVASVTTSPQKGEEENDQYEKEESVQYEEEYDAQLGRWVQKQIITITDRDSTPTRDTSPGSDVTVTAEEMEEFYDPKTGKWCKRTKYQTPIDSTWDNDNSPRGGTWRHERIADANQISQSTELGQRTFHKTIAEGKAFDYRPVKQNLTPVFNIEANQQQHDEVEEFEEMYEEVFDPVTRKWIRKTLSPPSQVAPLTETNNNMANGHRENYFYSNRETINNWKNRDEDEENYYEDDSGFEEVYDEKTGQWIRTSLGH
ncbi:uncharacterized protein LOC106151951 isoform X2 [Lingula anatina]|uniref:Uncharacterized protein LOC106151951 isoform X2 n=1 Tax=Lingula anatina TaxID=7574 RepID=A0A1S3H4G2_LINAN|nr:uncharacterized protein LOC106151951 isoform X2 [Lingula anatina]|eukprot:XP_013380852.1 uncharacterized protein LOC106151951 isoform X2 [Lingula anatina]